MKTLIHKIRRIFRNGNKTANRSPPAKDAEDAAAKKPGQPADQPIANDDGPPGYKIRWHQ